jgi:tetratricopeptide (TPR) repeat protein
VLLRLGQAHVARRSYTWAVETLEAWDDQDHPAVLGLLPLARSALGHALAAGDQWLAARQRLDAAVAAISPQLSPAGLANMSEIHLFRAIACVNTGDPEAAVEHLAKDATPLLDAALREPKGSDPASTLIEAVVNMHVLRAEVLVDHLDRVDDAVTAYDEAVALAELARDAEHVRISILGAKAAMLTERGRAGEALPLLQRCVDLMREGAKNGRGGDLAQALVSLAASQNGVGQPRLALGTIQQADALLTTNGDGQPHDADDEDEDDDDDAGDDDDGDDTQRQAIRGQLLHQRGAALTGVGHPLLAVDEFTRSIDISRALLEEDGESRYDASQQLPLALLLRARAWLDAGEHEEEAVSDLHEARVLYRRLFEDEARPAYGRRLEEVRALQRSLRKV